MSTIAAKKRNHSMIVSAGIIIGLYYSEVEAFPTMSIPDLTDRVVFRFPVLLGNIFHDFSIEEIIESLQSDGNKTLLAIIYGAWVNR